MAPQGLPKCDPEFVMKNANAAQMSLFELEKLENPRLSDRDAVRAICDRLLAESGVTVPVNVELLASMRGISRVTETVQGPAGMLVHHNGQMSAHIRASDSRPRKRFTILHEAGHTLLPGYVDSPHFRCAGRRTPEEQLCDHAASELLLPRSTFTAALLNAGFGTVGTEALASVYDASIEATAVRSVELWPDDALLLVLRVAHKPVEAGFEHQVEPKLRLAWSYGKGVWPYTPRHKSVKDSTPFARALAGEPIDEAGSLGELTRTDAGPVWIAARRYGASDRVLAMITRRTVRPSIRATRS
jgi:IrrE N-terminal-like domain